jgi:hypothetical protein
MTVSVSYIGKPEAIARQLAAKANELADADKPDFLEALSAVKALLKMNVDPSRAWIMQVDVTVSTATKNQQGDKTYGRVDVHVRTLGVMVE